MFRTLLLAGLVILSASFAEAKTVSGVDFPDTLSENAADLQLNGAGTRSKLFIKLYAAALYLQSPTADAGAILAADEPMTLSLQIVSGLIDSDKMEEAVVEGFDNATGGDTAPLQERIDRFISVLREEIKKEDAFVFSYRPASGTHVSKNGEEKIVIEGLDFKTALFGIWLSDKPAQKSLKKDLLGR
ncbi:MAG: chalcone isomerase family protein [Gammaproteobacteria bacterium]|nr:chalcone isomerase family protein [Gammaproteobacteria bacterium]